MIPKSFKTKGLRQNWHKNETLRKKKWEEAFNAALLHAFPIRPASPPHDESITTTAAAHSNVSGDGSDSATAISSSPPAKTYHDHDAPVVDVAMEDVDLQGQLHPRGTLDTVVLTATESTGRDGGAPADSAVAEDVVGTKAPPPLKGIAAALAMISKREEKESVSNKPNGKCESYGEGGKLVCCDTCNFMWHLQCYHPVGSA